MQVFFDVLVFLVLIYLSWEIYKMALTVSQVSEQLRTVAEQQTKTGVEIDSIKASNEEQKLRITALEEIIANTTPGGEATQELIDAAQAVIDGSKVNDEKIDDLVVPTP